MRSGWGPWFPKAAPLSASARDLIARLLQTDVSKRMTGTVRVRLRKMDA